MAAWGAIHGDICDVWQGNLTQEMGKISQVIKTHKYIAMDTEFPGVVESPNNFNVGAEYEYEKLMLNVNRLKLIQLGLSFFDENGNLATPVSTWQFNFHFNLGTDEGAANSLELLRNSGIDFERLRTEGIECQEFGHCLFGSGLVCFPENHLNWLVFQGLMDFGYLHKILTGLPLGGDLIQFQKDLTGYFVNMFDVKYIMSVQEGWWRGGLQDLVNMFRIQRTGIQHQAGSDSLVTGKVFFKIRALHFGYLEKILFRGVLYGLESYRTLFEEHEDCKDIENSPDFI